jgi:hypothetical protein
MAERPASLRTAPDTTSPNGKQSLSLTGENNRQKLHINE